MTTKLLLISISICLFSVFFVVDGVMAKQPFNPYQDGLFLDEEEPKASEGGDVPSAGSAEDATPSPDPDTGTDDPPVKKEKYDRSLSNPKNKHLAQSADGQSKPETVHSGDLFHKMKILNKTYFLVPDSCIFNNTIDLTHPDCVENTDNAVVPACLTYDPCHDEYCGMELCEE